MPKALGSTESEYRSNLTGLSTFFGAVLGFVMPEPSASMAWNSPMSCSWSAGPSSRSWYVHASSQKIIYSVLTFLLIAALPYILANVLDQGESLPDKLEPTLFEWALLSVVVECFPRRPDDPPASAA